MPYVKNFEEFAERHGGDRVEVNGRYVFRDGAQSNVHDHIEPPFNPRALISLQIEFLNAKLKEEEQKTLTSQQPRPESEVEFTERQGCPRVRVGNPWIYENGAVWAGQYGDEPPDDPVALLVLKCHFLVAMIEQTKRKFHQCQEYIFGQAEFHARNARPSPAEEAFAALKQFKADITKLRRKLRTKQAALRDHQGPSAAERYDEKRSRQRATARKAIKTLQKLNT